MPMGEICREWLEEVEPRVIRPLGWEGCWFIDIRKGRAGRNPADRNKLIDRTPKEHPQIWVMVYDAKTGWKSQKVQARTYIARLFWEFAFEPTFRNSYERKTRSGGVQVIHTDRWISSYKVCTTCEDARCVNPSHFHFLRDISTKLGGDGKEIRPNAGPKAFRTGTTTKALRKRGYYGPERGE